MSRSRPPAKPAATKKKATAKRAPDQGKAAAARVSTKAAAETAGRTVVKQVAKKATKNASRKAAKKASTKASKKASKRATPKRTASAATGQPAAPARKRSVNRKRASGPVATNLVSSPRGRSSHREIISDVRYGRAEGIQGHGPLRAGYAREFWSAAVSSQATLPVPSGTAALGTAADFMVTRLAPAPKGVNLRELRRTVVEADAALDARLQLALVNPRSRRFTLASAAVASGEVPVVARVRSFDAWRQMEGVHVGALIGTEQDGTIVATGRIPLQMVEAVRRDEAVISLNGSRPIWPRLANTISSMDVQPAAISHLGCNGGAGVVVGIVDIGGDFAHENFINADGTTRLLGLWDQQGPTRADSPFKYGRLYTPAEINAALGAANPYAALGYRPDRSPHGTHVMDIAAGNGRGTKQAGVAPKADLVFVDVSATDIDWAGPGAATTSFGDSVQMLEAIRFIFDLAGDRPCVVNISLGTNGGPHDGSTPVERGIDALVSERANRAVVIAAGNSFMDKIHTCGTVQGGAHHDIVWQVSGAQNSEFELWYPGNCSLTVELLDPTGMSLASVQPGQSALLGLPSTPVVFVSSRLNDSNNGDNVIAVWLAANVPPGDWTVRVSSQGSTATAFHAWVERSDDNQSSFRDAVDSHNLGSLSTGVQSICVGAYDADKNAEPLGYFTSAGPTRDGREKPELAAPGVSVLAAEALSGNGAYRSSGTSMAAPAVTGLVALMLAHARAHKVDLTIADIREKLKDGVKVPGAQWDARLGYGRANARAI